MKIKRIEHVKKLQRHLRELEKEINEVRIKLAEEQKECDHINCEIFLHTDYETVISIEGCCLICGKRFRADSSFFSYPESEADIKLPHYSTDVMNYDKLRKLMFSYIEENPKITKKELIKKLNQSELVENMNKQYTNKK